MTNQPPPDPREGQPADSAQDPQWPAPAQQGEQHGWRPPASGAHYGAQAQGQYGQGQYGQGQYGQAPYGYAPQGYGQASHGYYSQQGYYGYPSYDAWQRAQGPSNTAAVGGFVTSACSLALLLFIIGLSAPLTFIASIVGTVVSRNGIKKVDRGETTKSKDLAQWGFWLGIAGIVLSLIAAAIWVAIFIAADDLEDDFDSDTDPYTSVARVLVAVARLTLG